MTNNNFYYFRYIFWNAGGLGWSIGKREYLKSGTHWHKSNYNAVYIYVSVWYAGYSDDVEPWTSKWEGGVVVQCAERAGKLIKVFIKINHCNFQPRVVQI